MLILTQMGIPLSEIMQLEVSDYYDFLSAAEAHHYDRIMDAYNASSYGHIESNKKGEQHPQAKEFKKLNNRRKVALMIPIYDGPSQKAIDATRERRIMQNKVWQQQKKSLQSSSLTPEALTKTPKNQPII